MTISFVSSDVANTSTVHAKLLAILPRLQRFARTLTGSSVAADDLVQATCVRVLAGESGWAEGTSFEAWIFRILRNQWIDWARKRRIEGPVESIDKLADLIGDDGDKRAHFSLMLDEVCQTIDRLPPEQREVLLLVCVEEMSYREAAEVIGVPAGTVMSRLARARTKLAAVTEPKDAGEERRV